MLILLLLFLELVFAQPGHDTPSARAEFTPPNWEEMSDRELRVEVEKIKGTLRGSETQAFKTLLPLLSEPKTPEHIRILVAEGLSRFNLQALAPEYWETFLKLAVTDPVNAGAVRDRLARGLVPRAPFKLKPEQIEAIKKYLHEPKYREATISLLVAFEERAQPFLDDVRSDLEKDYNAQRILNHAGGEEARRFFRRKLNPDNAVDPQTVKAFTDKRFFDDADFELLLPLLHKKSTRISAKADIISALLKPIPTKLTLDAVKKFVEDAFNEGDEDLLVALDEKFLPMILKGSAAHPQAILEILKERLVTETDPLKKAVILNHLNAYLVYQPGIGLDTQFTTYLEKVVSNPGPKPTKEEFVAMLALMQRYRRSEYGKDDIRINEYLKDNKNKVRTLQQLERLPYEMLALMPTSAKTYVDMIKREEVPESRKQAYDFVRAMVALHASTGTEKHPLGERIPEEHSEPLQHLSAATQIQPTALTDQAVVTLAYYEVLPKEEGARLLSLLKHSNPRLAEAAFRAAAHNTLFAPLIQDEDIDSFIKSKSDDILATALHLTASQKKSEKLLALIKHSDPRTKTAAFKAAAFYDEISRKIPREMMVQFLDSKDEEAAQMATQGLLSQNQPLSERELTTVLANLSRSDKLKQVSLLLLIRREAQMKEVPAEVLKLINNPGNNYEALLLVTALGPKAANAVPELSKLVDPAHFNRWVEIAIVAIGPPAKELVPQLEAVGRSTFTIQSVYAYSALHEFGEDITPGIPRMRTLIQSGVTSIRGTAAGLLTKIPSTHVEGVRELLQLRANGEQDQAEADIQLKSVMTPQLIETLVALKSDADPIVAKQASELSAKIKK